MNLPDKISPCPIIDALFELRFISSLPIEAVFGVIFNSIKPLCKSEITKLPIMQIPDIVRSNDINFKYSACYELTTLNNYKIQIGSNVILIKAINPYPLWNNYRQEIIEIINNITQTEIIKTIERIGYRVIDFFNNNIFNNITINVIENQEPIKSKSLTIRTEKELENDLVAIIQIVNSVKYKEDLGSVLDIDVITTKPVLFKDILEPIEHLHKLQKKIFFSMLKEDFLITLNPHYNKE